MEQLEKTTQRDYSVYKSNDLIRKTRYDLTVAEQKIVLRLIQLIQPNDDSFKWYSFSVQEYCDLCGIDRSSGGNYQYLKKSIQTLSDKSFWVKLPNGKDTLCRWIQKARAEEGSGTIEIRLDEDLVPYLLQLKSNFTAYSLCNILGMKSKYSPRIYELVKSYEYKKHFEISIEDLKTMLDAGNYEYKHIRQKILDVATKEINALTDIMVEYTPIKDGRKVIAIRFDVRCKTMEESIDVALLGEKCELPE